MNWGIRIRVGSMIVEIEMLPLRPDGATLTEPLGFGMVLDAVVPGLGVTPVAMLPAHASAVFDEADVSRDGKSSASPSGSAPRATPLRWMVAHRATTGTDGPTVPGSRPGPRHLSRTPSHSLDRRARAR
jgi:hypothetical protein